jgi:hypothetical protein
VRLTFDRDVSGWRSTEEIPKQKHASKHSPPISRPALGRLLVATQTK